MKTKIELLLLVNPPGRLQQTGKKRILPGIIADRQEIRAAHIARGLTPKKSPAFCRTFFVPYSILSAMASEVSVLLTWACSPSSLYTSS